MSNRIIEIHDSRLDRLSMEANEAVLRFGEVYIHQSDGVPGVDHGTGWSQEAVIRIADGAVDGSFSGYPRYLGGGCLRVGSVVSDNTIPIPLDRAGGVELRLEGWGEVVSISGTHIRLELIGEAKYVEDFK